MKPSLSRKFRLVPALEPHEGTLSPAAFFPAIPVNVGDVSHHIVYATLDVSLQISRLGPEVLKQAHIPPVKTSQPSSPQGLVLVDVPLTVLDQDLGPWLYFRKIPFSVSPQLGIGTNPAQIVLGSRGFLAYLRVSLDFPRKAMTITPPRRFLIDRPPSSSVGMPSSFTQAEDLIDAGSYSSAVVLTTTGLEQTVLPTTYSLYPSSGSGRVAEILEQTAADPAMSTAVLRMYEVRNRAVHGPEADRITEAEARQVLSTAKQMLRKIRKSA